MADNRKKFIWTAVSVLLLLALAGGFAYAWLSGGNQIEPLIDSSVITQYFESGRGTEEDPFIIHTPRHLYNLAWLQYMGQFNQPDPDNPTAIRQYYFALCDGTNTYASEHGDSGIAELDMSGWTLPPVGTATYPFIGHFDGNGITISNLTVSGNYADLTNVADEEANFALHAYDSGNEGCDIVGLFGVVGAMGLNTDANGDGEPDAACSIEVDGSSYTYSSLANSISDLYIENITVTTGTDSVLAGLAAGYVNGTLSNVGVVSGTVAAAGTALDNSLTGNISDYTIVGHCEDAYKDTLTVRTVESDLPTVMISRTTAQDDGDAWGGSIDMNKLYTRLKAVRNAGSTAARTYITSETYTLDETTDPATYTAASTTAGYSADYTARLYYSELGGSYYFYNTNDNFLYLYGTNGDYTKTVTRYVYKDEYVDAYYLCHGDHYLSTDGSTLSDTTVEASATAWAYDEDAGSIYTIIDGIKYWLNHDGIGLSPDMTWSLPGSVLAGDYNGTAYYAAYESVGGWDITPYTSFYRITDGNGHYLNANASGILPAQTAERTKWYFSSVTGDPSGSIFTLIGGTPYYLNFSPDDGLVMSTTGATSWTNTGTSLRCTSGGINYYIAYENNTWQALSIAGYTIADNGVYLTVDNGAPGHTASSGGASLWTFSDTVAKAGTIYNPDSGYYLAGGANGALSLTTNRTQATTWTNESSKLYYTSGGVRYYLIYDSTDGWKAEPLYYYIHSGANYLRDNNGVTNDTLDNATRWLFSDPGDAPSGTIRNADNTSRYLYANRNSLGIGDTVRTWTNSNGTSLLETYRNRYLRYYNSAWRVATAQYSVTITPTVDETLSITAAGDVGTAPETAPVRRDEDTAADKMTAPDMQIVEKTVATRDSGYPTYFPINGATTAPFNAADANTGYFIGGGYSAASSSGRGDIRVSRYAISNISTSYAGGSFTQQTSRDRIYTINGSGDHVITAAEESAYQKYADSKAGLLEVLQLDNTYVYGLHFMKTAIDKDSYVVAPHVLINGVDHYDFQMPTSCIDFTLQEKGYINFFAGTYYGGNRSFFSLHQIIRDEHEELKEIREISKVYTSSDESEPCIYEYTAASGGGYSGGYTSLPAGYSLAFDTAWIKTQSSLQSSALYYFEIPANEGEYALGSDPDSDGAYLIYLDISANAQILQRQEATEIIASHTGAYEYPAGVALSGASFTSDTDSVCYTMDAGGAVTLSRSGNAATVTSASGEAGFIGDGVTLTKGGNELSASALSQTAETIKRMTRYDYNQTTKQNSQTVFVTTVTETDGVQTRTYTVNGAASDDDDGADIARGTLGLRYHYEIPNGVAVTDSITLSGPTQTGFAGISTYPEVGEDAVDATSQLTIGYEVTETVTGGYIRLCEDYLADGFTAAVNGSNFVAGGSIILPTPQGNRMLTVRRPASAGLSAASRGTASFAPAVGAGEHAEYVWEIFSDTSLLTWLRDPARADEIAETLVSGGEAYASLWNRVLTMEDDELNVLACERIYDILSGIGDPEESPADLALLSDEEFYAFVIDPFRRAELQRILADENGEAYAQLYGRLDSVAGDRLFFGIADHLRRLASDGPVYAWTYMTDEAFTAWIRAGSNAAELRFILQDAGSEEFASLMGRFYDVRDSGLQTACMEALAALMTAEPFPGFEWDDMDDGAFAEWLCAEENADAIVLILADPQSDAAVSLQRRADAIEDEEFGAAAAERMAQLGEILLQRFPWINMDDDEFAAWLADEENAGLIAGILADEESGACALLLSRLDAVEDASLRQAAAERLEALGEQPASWPWAAMTDEELVTWLGTDAESIRALLADGDGEAYAGLIARIGEIENEEQAEAARELLAGITAPEEKPPESETGEPAEGGEPGEGEEPGEGGESGEPGEPAEGEEPGEGGEPGEGEEPGEGGEPGEPGGGETGETGEPAEGGEPAETGEPAEGETGEPGEPGESEAGEPDGPSGDTDGGSESPPDESPEPAGGDPPGSSEQT